MSYGSVPYAPGAHGSVSHAPLSYALGRPRTTNRPGGAGRSSRAAVSGPPPGEGFRSYRPASHACPSSQKVSLKPLMVPLSPEYMSWTLSFQVPLATSDEALTV